MSTRTEATVDDLYRVPENGKAEIVNGALVLMTPLPHRRSFSPDTAFFKGGLRGGLFLEGAPLFAVEVRSSDDYGPRAEVAMAQKRADYFAAGTLVVWDVDVLCEKVVRVFRASDPQIPTVYQAGDIAEAEPALPGWTMRVDQIFG